MMLNLEEVKSTVLLACIRADAPLAVSIHVIPTGADHGAAPGLALVLPAIHPLSTAAVGHSLELEGKDALFANSRTGGGGAPRLERVGVHRRGSGGGRGTSGGGRGTSGGGRGTCGGGAGCGCS